MMHLGTVESMHKRRVIEGPIDYVLSLLSIDSNLMTLLSPANSITALNETFMSATTSSTYNCVMSIVKII